MNVPPRVIEWGVIDGEGRMEELVGAGEGWLGVRVKKGVTALREERRPGREIIMGVKKGESSALRAHVSG